MTEYPKFLYCQNELEGSEEYILHTEIPRFLAKKIYHDEHCMFDIAWVDRPAYDESFLARLMSDLKAYYNNYQDYLSKPGNKLLTDK